MTSTSQHWPKAIGTGQVGATYRITLNFAGDPHGFPPTIVAKLPSNDELSRTTGKSHLTYLRESRFYQTFRGQKADGGARPSLHRLR
jgi:hypothetical protein